MVAGSLLAVRIIVNEANIYKNIAKIKISTNDGLLETISVIVFPINRPDKVLIRTKVIIG